MLVAAIGDVQGHSLHAATVMGELRHALRAFADEGHPPRAIARLVNSVLQRYHPDIIATLCLLQLDLAHRRPGDRQLRAHPGRSWSIPAAPPTAGRAACCSGCTSTMPHVEHAVLPPGGTILMITDGLVEDRHSALDDNLERLRQAAASAAPAIWTPSPTSC